MDSLRPSIYTPPEWFHEYDPFQGHPKNMPVSEYNTYTPSPSEGSHVSTPSTNSGVPQSAPSSRPPKP